MPLRIVDDVSFDVARGEVLALIGESGSGKTTIALALMGYARSGATIGGQLRVGDATFDGDGGATLAAQRGHRITYVAQSAAAAFNPARRVMDQVIEPALIHGVATVAAARAHAVDLFRALALPAPETIGSRYPHELSGGQLQRLMAAMALITRPDLVIFDEPTTALDVTTQVEVLQAFRRVFRETGRDRRLRVPTISPWSPRSPIGSSSSIAARCGSRTRRARCWRNRRTSIPGR